jgi:hypothetical protein
MIARRNICCLVEAGKHVNNIGDFARKLPITTIELLEAVFYVASVLMLYSEDPSTLNFNNNMSTAAIFFDIEKAFNITCQLGLLYKLSTLLLSITLIKLIVSFLFQKKIQSFDRR